MLPLTVTAENKDLCVDIIQHLNDENTFVILSHTAII